MPSTGRNNYEEIPSDESVETYVPMRRADAEGSNEYLEPDQLVGKTSGGKELYICKHPQAAGYYFRFGKGGQLPPQLDGLWTSFHIAEKEGKIYLANN